MLAAAILGQDGTAVRTNTRLDWASDVLLEFPMCLLVVFITIGVLVYGPRVPMDCEIPSTHGKLHLMPFGIFS